jgi:hypothetical protein
MAYLVAAVYLWAKKLPKKYCTFYGVDLSYTNVCVCVHRNYEEAEKIEPQKLCIISVYII